MRKTHFTFAAILIAVISTLSLTLLSRGQEPEPAQKATLANSNPVLSMERRQAFVDEATNISAPNISGISQSPLRTVFTPQHPGRVIVNGSVGQTFNRPQAFSNRLPDIRTLSEEEQTAANNLLAATEKLRSTESDEERQIALEELKTALEADYDARLSQYEKQLDIMEKKVEEMREKLQKRRAAKSELVELRVKLIDAEASDLGWPSRLGNRATTSTTTRGYINPSQNRLPDSNSFPQSPSYPNK